jgi:hypothetical protein
MLLRGQDGFDRHPKLSQAGDFADIPSLLEVIRRFQSRSQGQLLILVSQLNHALTHAPASAVDANNRFHGMTSRNSHTNPKSEFRNPKQIQMTREENPKQEPRH